MDQQPLRFDHNFHRICDALGDNDADLKTILTEHGYPPLWSREPNFKTVVHFILEQQVSLSSARAALNKLEELIGLVTPEKLLTLTNEDLRSCYFSRQKTIYAQCLAKAIINRQIDFELLPQMPDDLVRHELKKIKGIGDWTADVFLMMSLHRCNLFPTGDVALMKSIRAVKNLPPTAGKEHVLQIAKQWEPYRSVAAYLLWHAYLQQKSTGKKRAL